MVARAHPGPRGHGVRVRGDGPDRPRVRNPLRAPRRRRAERRGPRSRGRRHAGGTPDRRVLRFRRRPRRGGSGRSAPDRRSVGARRPPRDRRRRWRLDARRDRHAGLDPERPDRVRARDRREREGPLTRNRHRSRSRDRRIRRPARRVGFLGRPLVRERFLGPPVHDAVGRREGRGIAPDGPRARGRCDRRTVALLRLGRRRLRRSARRRWMGHPFGVAERDGL